MAEDVQKYDFKTAVSTAKYRRNMMNMAEDARIHLEHQQWMVSIFEICLVRNKNFKYFLTGETSEEFEQSQLELKAPS